MNFCSRAPLLSLFYKVEVELGYLFTYFDVLEFLEFLEEEDLFETFDFLVLRWCFGTSF